MKLKTAWNFIAERFHREVEKIRPLSPKEKLAYIWEYYKIHILIIAFVLYAIISLSISIYNNNKGGEIAFGIGIVNDATSADALKEPLALGFGEYLGLVYGEQQVNVNTSYTVSDEMSDYQAMLNTIMFIDASAGDVDVVVCQKDVVDYFSPEQEAWLDIRTVLDEAIIEKLSDRLCYAKDTEGNKYPCGIYLPDATLGTESSLTLQDPILVFLTAGQHRDYLDDIVNYLFADELAE